MKSECKTCAKDKCPMHPDYQAKRKPRCSCKVCWEIWEKHQKTPVKSDKYQYKRKIRAKNGLLYEGVRMISLPEADFVAREHGFVYAEDMVKHLEKTQHKERKERAMKKKEGNNG